MTRLLRRALLLAVLLASPVLARAGVSYEESPPFPFDTRDYLAGLAAESPTFTFDTRAIDGLSKSGTSGVFSFDTRSLGLPTLVVSGVAHINPGVPEQYTCAAYYPGLPPEPVTNSAAWNIEGGPPGTTIARGRVTPGKGLGGVARITASVGPPTGGRRTSLPFEVTIGPSLRVVIPKPVVTEQSRTGQIFQWRVRTTVVTTPVGAGATYVWAWKEELIPGQGGPSLDTIITSPAGSGELTAYVTDPASGAAGLGYRSMTFDKTPVANEGVPVETTYKVEPGARPYLDAQGADFVFDANRAEQGLIVLTHGMRLDDNEEGHREWLKAMADEIGARIEEVKLPNILIYDWLHDARATEDFDADEANRRVVEYFRKYGPELVGKSDAEKVEDLFQRLLKQERFNPNLASVYHVTNQLTWERWKPVIRAAIVNAVLSRDRGTRHGELFLAKRLLEKVATGEINQSKPIHLIGHSSGGFVMGECAQQLKANGYLGPILVTMLDTPFPWDHHKPNPASGIRVERYISSLFARGWFAQQWDAKSVTYVPGSFGLLSFDPRSKGRWVTSYKIVPNNVQKRTKKRTKGQVNSCPHPAAAALRCLRGGGALTARAEGGMVRA